MTSDPPGWRVQRLSGRAGGLHALPVPEEPSPVVWVMAVERPAIVLGSTQPDQVADDEAAARAGVDVVRRRSGGGAVLLEPRGQLWVDVVVPRGHPLWCDDVGEAFLWLGDAWARALRAIGLAGEVHRGAMVRTPWSSTVCFAGLGPGEVRVDGRKVVGVSQRRTRAAARFQCTVLARWEPRRLADVLRLDEVRRAQLVDDLREVAVGVGPALDDLQTAFLAALG